MYLKYYDYLKDILGDYVTKFENANDDDLRDLISTLQFTNLKEILDLSTLQDLCYKLVYGKYKETFRYVLWLVGHIDTAYDIPLDYQRFIYYYIDFGYNNAKKYREIFNFVKVFFFSKYVINYDDIINLVDNEMYYISKNEDEENLFNAHDLVELTDTLIKYKDKTHIEDKGISRCRSYYEHEDY